MKRLILICTILLAVTAIVVAADPKKPADHGLFLPDQIKWMDAPNALPPGSKLAVLEGDPFKHELYTMRRWLQDPAAYAYRVRARHSHQRDVQPRDGREVRRRGRDKNAARDLRL